jgi:hypothetical protein
MLRRRINTVLGNLADQGLPFVKGGNFLGGRMPVDHIDDVLNGYVEDGLQYIRGGELPHIDDVLSEPSLPHIDDVLEDYAQRDIKYLRGGNQDLVIDQMIAKLREAREKSREKIEQAKQFVMKGGMMTNVKYLKQHFDRKKAMRGGVFKVNTSAPGQDVEVPFRDYAQYIGYLPTVDNVFKLATMSITIDSVVGDAPADDLRTPLYNRLDTVLKSINSPTQLYDLAAHIKNQRFDKFINSEENRKDLLEKVRHRLSELEQPSVFNYEDKIYSVTPALVPNDQDQYYAPILIDRIVNNSSNTAAKDERLNAIISALDTDMLLGNDNSAGIIVGDTLSISKRINDIYSRAFEELSEKSVGDEAVDDEDVEAVDDEDVDDEDVEDVDEQTDQSSEPQPVSTPVVAEQSEGTSTSPSTPKDELEAILAKKIVPGPGPKSYSYIDKIVKIYDLVKNNKSSFEEGFLSNRRGEISNKRYLIKTYATRPLETNKYENIKIDELGEWYDFISFAFGITLDRLSGLISGSDSEDAVAVLAETDALLDNATERNIANLQDQKGNTEGSSSSTFVAADDATDLNSSISEMDPAKIAKGAVVLNELASEHNTDAIKAPLVPIPGNTQSSGKAPMSQEEIDQMNASALNELYNEARGIENSIVGDIRTEPEEKKEISSLMRQIKKMYNSGVPIDTKSGSISMSIKRLKEIGQDVDSRDQVYYEDEYDEILPHSGPTERITVDDDDDDDTESEDDATAPATISRTLGTNMQAQTTAFTKQPVTLRGNLPGTAAPSTAAPSTAVPGTAVPGTAVPRRAVPSTAVPGTAVPGTAVPGTAVPGTAVPAHLTAPLPDMSSLYSPYDYETDDDDVVTDIKYKDDVRPNPPRAIVGTVQADKLRREERSLLAARQKAVEAGDVADENRYIARLAVIKRELRRLQRTQDERSKLVTPSHVEKSKNAAVLTKALKSRVKKEESETVPVIKNTNPGPKSKHNKKARTIDDILEERVERSHATGKKKVKDSEDEKPKKRATKKKVVESESDKEVVKKKRTKKVVEPEPESESEEELIEVIKKKRTPKKQETERPKVRKTPGIKRVDPYTTVSTMGSKPKVQRTVTKTGPKQASGSKTAAKKPKQRRAPNKWNMHMQATRDKYPGLDFVDLVKKAKATYK